MNGSPEKFGRLSSAERDVMEAIWRMEPPITVARVLGALEGKRRSWAPQTLATVMDRLIEKGFLTLLKRGKPNIYEPAILEEAHRERQSRDFLKSVHSGSLMNFVATLANGDGISRGEIEELRAWFERERGEERK
jgi:predicted transcriptional regulator